MSEVAVDCALVDRQLAAWIDDALEPAQAARIDAHMSDCVVCQTRLRQEERYLGEVMALRDSAIVATPELCQRVLGALKQVVREEGRALSSSDGSSSDGFSSDGSSSDENRGPQKTVSEKSAAENLGNTPHAWWVVGGVAMAAAAMFTFARVIPWGDGSSVSAGEPLTEKTTSQRRLQRDQGMTTDQRMTKGPIQARAASTGGVLEPGRSRGDVRLHNEPFADVPLPSEVVRVHRSDLMPDLRLSAGDANARQQVSAYYREKVRFRALPPFMGMRSVKRNDVHGLKMTGTRYVTLKGARGAASFFYQDARGRRLTVVVTEGAGDSESTNAESISAKVKMHNVHGFPVAMFERHGLAYVVTGDVSRATISELIEAIETQSVNAR